MGKQAAGPLPQDSLQTYIDGLLDPATGTFYFKRVFNKTTSANGDYGDQGIVVVGPNGQPLLPAAAAFAESPSLPTTSFINATMYVYDPGNNVLRSFISNQINGVDPAVMAAIETMEYNGSSLDARRNNIEGTLLASAARTAGTLTANQTLHNGRGVKLYLQITAAPNTAETLALIFKQIEPVSGLTAAQAASITTTAGSALQGGTFTFELTIAPGATGTSDSPTYIKAYALAVGRTWLAQVNPSGASSWTYSLGYATVA